MRSHWVQRNRNKAKGWVSKKLRRSISMCPSLPSRKHRCEITLVMNEFVQMTEAYLSRLLCRDGRLATLNSSLCSESQVFKQTHGSKANFCTFSRDSVSFTLEMRIPDNTCVIYMGSNEAFV